MAVDKDELIEQLELRTQENSVLITDSKESSYGSGVLFFPGSGDIVYIFTCAHVIDELEGALVIKFLLPKQREIEDYTVCTINVKESQVVYSPIDKVIEEDGKKKHSVDVAVIYFKKNERLVLEATEYCIAEASKGNPVFAQGFPDGTTNVKELLEALDIAHGRVLHNVPESHTFVFRVDDKYLDTGSREYELKGFSGSPVWNSEDEVLSILGLMSSGVGETVYRGRVNAVKMDVVRSVMQDHFHVHIDTRIVGIPEKDVSGKSEELCFDGTLELEQPESVYDQWLIVQTEKVRAYIDDSKLQKAIDLAKEAIQNENFEKCSSDLVEKHFKHLLYCYEIALLDEEFEETEKYMQKKKLLDGHDPLRWMTSNFSKRNYKETIEFAEEIIEKEPEDTTLGIMARFFAVICKAYSDNAPVSETMLKFLDENENLIVEVNDPESRALIYQMLGYVYGECYKEYTRSVRCLNRSYRIGHDSAVLECLGCSYYFLSLEHAIREDNSVDMEKINRAELNKARECFLIILEKADDLMLSATMKRVGMIIFNTFYFLQDSYRVLTLYPKVKEHVKFIEDRDKRDFELKYAKTLCQGGRIDVTQFETLKDEDIMMIELIGSIKEFMLPFEGVNPVYLSGNSQISEMLCQLISFAEQCAVKMDEKEKPELIIELINLYGFGHRCFNWAVGLEMERHLTYIRTLGNEKLCISLENFLFENIHPLDEAEQRFIESLNHNPSIEMWGELLRFYIRNGMLDKADMLYMELFDKHSELIKDEPEYACRGYIDYIVRYRRDIKNALRIYVDHKEEMKDSNLRDFWEHELMTYTGSFNDPDKFEEERNSFVQQGLIPEEEYHRIVLVAYMCNLNSKKAWEHFSKDNPYFGVNIQRPEAVTYLSKEGAQFLVWQKQYPPHKEVNWNGIIEKNIQKTLNAFRSETWHQKIDGVKERVNYKLDRSVAMDAWAVYLTAVECKLDTLKKFDCVYVTHSSITRMLEEMCHYENLYFTSALAYFEVLDNLKIVSPDFEYQLKVRDTGAEYFEPCSTVAIALEKNCAAVIGEPLLSRELINGFREIIVRPCDYDQLWKE